MAEHLVTFLVRGDISVYNRQCFIIRLLHVRLNLSFISLALRYPPDIDMHVTQKYDIHSNA